MTGTAESAGHHRRRGGLAWGVTAAVVAVIATPLLLLGGGKAAPTAATPPVSASASPSAAVPTSSAASSTVLADGQTVEATGRIVSVPGKPVRICAPEMMDAIGYAAGQEPAPAWCPLGVDVTGVTLATLQQPRTKNGATEGWGYVRGVYRNGTVAVSVQSGQRTSLPTYPALSDMSAPPCPKPVAGWHRESRGSNPVIGDKVSAYGQNHPGQIEAAAIYRPNDTTGVVVAAVKDLAAARAALPDDPGSLCLLAGKYTSAQVAAAEAPFAAEQAAQAKSPHGTVVSVSETVGPDWQRLVSVQVVAITANVEKWAAAAPAGLVSLVPWLAVVAPGSPLPALLATAEQTVSPASAAVYASEDAAYPSGYVAPSGVAVSTSAAPSGVVDPLTPTLPPEYASASRDADLHETDDAGAISMPWILTGRHGRQLDVVFAAGDAGCVKPIGYHVVYAGSSIELALLSKSSPAAACGSALKIMQGTVTLSADLGDRKLLHAPVDAQWTNTLRVHE